MKYVLPAWQLLVVILACLINHQQQKTIEYLVLLVRIVIEQRDAGVKQLNNDQRRRLAVKGRRLGYKQVRELNRWGVPFTPKTLLEWHKKLVAKKWNYSCRRKKIGRPRIDQEIVDQILRFARENPSWGYDRIQGALGNLGYAVSDQTIGNVLKRHGIEPAPERKKTGSWSTFLKAHWDVLAAVDFTTAEVWTPRGLLTFYLLFVMELKTRRVYFAGTTVNPNTDWMKQVARELTAWDAGFLKNKEYLIMDRDTKFCEAFRFILEDSEVEPVILPAQSPNLNANLERFMGSFKRELVDEMIFFGERSLRSATKEFLIHYHRERNHQGLENQLIDPEDEVAISNTNPSLPIQCRERLGGMLRYYYRAA